MGACASVQDRTALERSAEIDRQIEEDSRRFRKECKILLLGAFFFFTFFLSLFSISLFFFLLFIDCALVVSLGCLEWVFCWEGRWGIGMLDVVGWLDLDTNSSFGRMT